MHAMHCKIPIIITLLFVLENEWGFHFEASKSITYDKLDLIVPDRREMLLSDLRERTGLPIRHVNVGRMDFVRDTAEIVVFYDDRDLPGAGRNE